MSSSKEQFTMLLFHLSQKLVREELKAIVHIYDLPKCLLEEMSGLSILVNLNAIGKISETDPSTLQGIFKGINRMDLVDKVKEFIKNSKSSKRSKKRAPKKELEDDREFVLKVHKEVTMMQAKLLVDQLNTLAEIASQHGVSCVQRAAKQAVDAVRKEVTEKLKSALEEMEKSDSSSSSGSESDDSPRSTLTRSSAVLCGPPPQLEKLLKKSLVRHQESNKSISSVSTVTSNSSVDEEEEGEYMEIFSSHLAPPTPPTVPTHYYDTAGIIPTMDSLTKPEGSKTGTVLVSKSSCSKETTPLNRRRPMPPPKPAAQQHIKESEDSGAEDCTGSTCSYTGSAYTGNSDSGFSDVRRYLKKPIPAPKPRKVQQGYQEIDKKAMNLSYYKSTARKDDRFQRLMAEDDDVHEDFTNSNNSLYENIHTN